MAGNPPYRASPGWQIVILPADDDEWVLSTYSRDDRLLAVAFRHGHGDYRIGTFGMARSVALDRSYASLADAQLAVEDWVAAIYPAAPVADPHPGITDEDIPF